MAAPNAQLPTLRAFDWNAFDIAYGDVIGQHERLIRTGRNSLLASQSAERLATIVNDLRIRICQTDNLAEVERFLRDGESVFTVAQIMSELVSHDKVQCFDLLKLQLSRCTADLMNIAVFQCGLQNRSIYLSTADKIKRDLRQAIKTLVFQECETEFRLKCAHAAAKKLDVDKGKWRTFFVQHRGELAEGALGVVLSPSPIPPYISLAPLAGPIMRFCVGAYQTRETAWYSVIWMLMFEAERGGFSDIERFRALKKEILKDHTDYKKYFYFTVLFKEMLSREISQPLREEIIAGRRISLRTLIRTSEAMDERLTARQEQKWARVRYNALKVLGGTRYPGATQWISNVALRPVQDGGEKRREVRELAQALLAYRPRPVPPVPFQAAPPPPAAEEQPVRPPEVDETLEVIGEVMPLVAEEVSRIREEAAQPGNADGDIQARINEHDQGIIDLNRLLEPLKPGTIVEEGVGDQIDVEEIERQRIFRETERDRLQDIMDTREDVQRRELFTILLRQALQSGDWSNFDQTFALDNPFKDLAGNAFEL